MAAGPSAGAGASLINDGDFTLTKTSKELRADNKGPDWFESRRQVPGGRVLLKLSAKPIAGNATPKAMIKAHPDLNTYLTQKFAKPATADFTVQFDILVKDILADDNHSAFVMVGSDRDKKNGPNSTGNERFAFLGFENAVEKGKINLFARQGKLDWPQKTLVAKGLNLNQWYTIELTIYPKEATYEAMVKGVTPQAIELQAFAGAGKPPKKLTAISFASWNDGAGTFYVDNVIAHLD
jgi:hypothetical protein